MASAGGIGSESRSLALSSFWWSVLAIALALNAVGLSLRIESGDYQFFLLKWVEYIRNHGGFAALAHNFSNYNVAYLFLLAAVSYLSVAPLLPIKLISLAFQLLLGYYIGKFAMLHYGENAVLWCRLMGYAVALLLPTAMFDSMIWAQCDIIYASLAVGAVYYLAVRRPVASMTMMGLALAFKLQAVFVLPVFLVALLARRMKWWHLGVCIAVFIGVLLPAAVIGRPWHELLGIYTNQSSFYDSYYVVGLGNLYTLLCCCLQRPLSPMMIRLWTLAAIIIVAAMCAFIARSKVIRSGKRADYVGALLDVSLLFSFIVPMLLPGMHERYLFAADAFAVVCCVWRPRRWPLYAAVVLTSLMFMLNAFTLPDTAVSAERPFFYIVSAFYVLVASVLVWFTAVRRGGLHK